MFNIVLYQPEIAPNTGSIMRLAANTGCKLHLIEPLGFVLNDKKLRRAGLDYLAKPTIHPDIASVKSELAGPLYHCTTKAKTLYTDIAFEADACFLFGPETRGLPDDILDNCEPEKKIKIPMHPNGRSLNLAMAVAIIVYEAWRQHQHLVIT